MKKTFILIIFICVITLAHRGCDASLLGDLLNKTETFLTSLDADTPNTNKTLPLTNNATVTKVKESNITSNVTISNSTTVNRTMELPVNKSVSITRNATVANESTKCNASSTMKCVLHPSDIGDKNAFPSYNLSFLSDICQKTCLNSSNCVYMSTAQVEDLIKTGELGNLQAECLGFIPISIWKNVTSELLDAEFGKHQYILQSWLKNTSNSSDLSSFVPKLVQLPKTRKALFSSNLEGLDRDLCSYVQIKDFSNTSQLADASFTCMRVMLNDSAKCSAIPENFFGSTNNSFNASNSENLDTVMDHIKEAITLTCFQSMNPKVQQFISRYMTDKGKLGSFNIEIVNYLNSVPKSTTPAKTNLTETQTTNVTISSNNTEEHPTLILSTGNVHNPQFGSLFDTSDGHSKIQPLVPVFSLVAACYALVM